MAACWNKPRQCCEGMTLTTISASRSASCKSAGRTDRFGNALPRQKSLVDVASSDSFAHLRLKRPQANAMRSLASENNCKAPCPMRPRR